MIAQNSARLEEYKAATAEKVRQMRLQRKQERAQHPSALSPTLATAYTDNKERKRQRRIRAINFQRERDERQQERQARPFTFEMLLKIKRLTMPIIGMTDQNDVELYEALSRLGNLRKGGVKPVSGKAPGKDLDHFRVTFEPEYAHLGDTFVQLYGNEPDRFEDVFMAGDTVADAYPTWMEEHGASTLKHRCDGQTQVLRWEDGDYCHDKIPCARLSGEGCKCKQIGKLRIILRDLYEETGVLGWFEVKTHSKHDIIRLHNALTLVAKKAGALTSVPFVFGRAPRTITRPNGSNRAKTEKSLLYLHAEPEYMKAALPGNGDAQALPESDDDLLTIEAGESVEAEIVEDDPLARLAETDPLPPELSEPLSDPLLAPDDSKTATHWTKIDRLSDFITWTLEQGLSLQDTLDALDVDALDTYTGTEKEAADTVQAFVAQKVDADSIEEADTDTDQPDSEQPSLFEEPDRTKDAIGQ